MRPEITFRANPSESGWMSFKSDSPRDSIYSRIVGGVVLAVLLSGVTGVGESLTAFFHRADVIDKVGHFIFFGALSFLIHRSVRVSLAGSTGMVIAVSCSIAFVLGVADEFSQIWINDRNFDYNDLWANMLGVCLIGPLACFTFENRRISREEIDSISVESVIQNGVESTNEGNDYEGRRVRVLLVEDDLRIRSGIMEMFESLSRSLDHHAVFDLKCVGSLRECLEHMSDCGADVVLLDLTLPDAHGVTVFNETARFFPNVPVIVLANINAWSAIVDGSEFSACNCLVKSELGSKVLFEAVVTACERNSQEVLSYELQSVHQELASHQLTARGERVWKSAANLQARDFGLHHLIEANRSKEMSMAKLINSHEPSGLN